MISGRWRSGSAAELRGAGESPVAIRGCLPDDASEAKTGQSGWRSEFCMIVPMTDTGISGCRQYSSTRVGQSRVIPLRARKLETAPGTVSLLEGWSLLLFLLFEGWASREDEDRESYSSLRFWRKSSSAPQGSTSNCPVSRSE